jgi:hypothetical protein
MKHLATNAIDALHIAFGVLRLLFGGAPSRLAERIEAQVGAISLRATLPRAVDSEEANRALALARAAHEQGKALRTQDIQAIIPDLSCTGAARLLRLICESAPGAWTTVNFLPLGEGDFAPAVIEPTVIGEEAGEGQGE